MSKVIHITGEPIPAPGEPVDVVVDMLRDLLAKAEAGEIKAIVGVAMHSDNSLYTFERGQCGYDAIRGALFSVLINLG